VYVPRNSIAIPAATAHAGTRFRRGAEKNSARMGTISFDAVKHLRLCRIEQRPARLDLENYPHLPLAQGATAAAADDLALLEGC
jgi:hypothetical protein